jgi:hypothetical protein
MEALAPAINLLLFLYKKQSLPANTLTIYQFYRIGNLARVINKTFQFF